MSSNQAFLAVVRNWKALCAVPTCIAAVTALVLLITPDTYTATTQVVPPQGSASTAQLLLSQTILPPQLGNALGFKNQGDLYAAMLRSRSVADALVKRFNLQDVYDEEFLADAREELHDRTTITVNRSSVITIRVDDHDPRRAADIANAYVDELNRIGASLANSEASQRRAFFERQLKESNENLAAAELALRKIQEKTGIIKLDDQGRVIIENIARLQALVDAKRVEISALEVFSSKNNPDLSRARRELEALRAQLAKAQQDSTAQPSVFVPAAKVPAIGLEYVRHLREVKYQEAVFEMLIRQLEVAKLDEARESSTVQVLDVAVPPEKKSGPKRALIVLLSALLSAMLTALGTIAWAYVRASLR